MTNLTQSPSRNGTVELECAPAPLEVDKPASPARRQSVAAYVLASLLLGAGATFFALHVGLPLLRLDDRDERADRAVAVAAVEEQGEAVPAARTESAQQNDIRPVTPIAPPMPALDKRDAELLNNVPAAPIAPMSAPAPPAPKLEPLAAPLELPTLIPIPPSAAATGGKPKLPAPLPTDIRERLTTSPPPSVAQLPPGAGVPAPPLANPPQVTAIPATAPRPQTPVAPAAPPPPIYQVKPDTPVKELLPPSPNFKPPLGPVVTNDLALVPEVALGLLADRKTPGDEQRAVLAVQLIKIEHLNQQQPDGFIEALAAERADLAGLPLLSGGASRQSEERRREFQAEAIAIRLGRQPENPQFWKHYFDARQKDDQANAAEDREFREHVTLARIAALMQVLVSDSSSGYRKGLVQYLAGVMHAEATRALAKLALFATEDEVRAAAIEALTIRRERDYTPLLLEGLRYPWPAVAKHAADAIVKLERNDLIPQLVDLLDAPDPRAPVQKEVRGKQVPVVRELVRINHHRNCLLCHAPGEPQVPDLAVAAIPIPTEPLPTPVHGYQPKPQDLLVRTDVTYLRQDFSALLPVSDAPPWPKLQGFEFVVRTRVLSDDEAKVYHQKLKKHEPGAVTPYERAILSALRELTGRDTEPTAAGWRKLLNLPPTPRRDEPLD